MTDAGYPLYSALVGLEGAEGGHAWLLAVHDL